MFIRLSGGREARVFVSHVDAQGRSRPRRRDLGGLPAAYRPRFVPRATVVGIQVGEATVAQTASTCSERDNFCRRTGRRVAANRLLASLRTGVFQNSFSKEDRRAVYRAICPEDASRKEAAA